MKKLNVKLLKEMIVVSVITVVVIGVTHWALTLIS